MNMQTAKRKDDQYSRNLKFLSFVLFPFYDSYHRLCCVTLTGTPNENIVQNHLNIALLNVF